MGDERVAHRDPLGRGKRVRHLVAKPQLGDARLLGRNPAERDAIRGITASIAFAGAIPFRHGEFRMVQRGPGPRLRHTCPRLAIRRSAGRRELLHRRFRRGVEMRRGTRPSIADHLGRKGVPGRVYVAGASLQARRVNHQGIPRRKNSSARPVRCRARARSTGSRSRCRSGLHQGETGGLDKGLGTWLQKSCGNRGMKQQTGLGRGLAQRGRFALSGGTHRSAVHASGPALCRRF